MKAQFLGAIFFFAFSFFCLSSIGFSATNDTGWFYWGDNINPPTTLCQFWVDRDQLNIMAPQSSGSTTAATLTFKKTKDPNFAAWLIDQCVRTTTTKYSTSKYRTRFFYDSSTLEVIAIVLGNDP